MRKVKEVYPLQDYCLVVVFENDEKRICDIKPLMKGKPIFARLAENSLFQRVYIEYGAVTWKTDDGYEIDICPDKIYEDSLPFVSPFDGLMSFSDAAHKWNIDDSTLRKAAICGRLIDGIDIRKFGKQWVISEDAMERLFGSSAR